MRQIRKWQECRDTSNEVTERQEEENRAESVFEAVVTEKFPKVIKDLMPPIQEVL